MYGVRVGVEVLGVEEHQSDVRHALHNGAGIPITPAVTNTTSEKKQEGKKNNNTDDRCNTKLAKMSIDRKFVELTADVVRIIA